MRNANLPLVAPGDTLLAGLAIIDAAGFELALVVDGDLLVGIITDGDCRRAILRGLALDTPLAAFMQTRYTSVGPEVGRAEVLDLMKVKAFRQVPAVDGEGRLVGLHLLDDFLGLHPKPNGALILCGGLGTRLRPLTETVPKPMIKVAGRPILERIILHLVGGGIRDIYLAVHYLADKIEAHFGDGAAFGCRITYLRETTPLGTGGALGLLPGPLVQPILVMNGDLITQFDVTGFLACHAAAGNMATVGVQPYAYQVPFGVFETRGDQVVAIHEKPVIRKLANAGIYVLEPVLVTRVVPGQATTLPTLLEGCLAQGERVGTFFVDEDWADVGRHEELARARGQR